MKVHELKSFLETCESDLDIVVEVGHDGIYQFGDLTNAQTGVSWTNGFKSPRKVVTFISVYTTKEAE